MKRLLVGVDKSAFSSTCAQYAIYYARNLGARLDILHVAERRERRTVQHIVPELTGRHMDDVQKLRGERLLSELVVHCEKSGVESRIHLAHGNPEEVLVDYSRDVDLVLIGQKGFGAEFTFGLEGRTVRAMVRSLFVPLIVTPSTFRPLRDVLVAYDDSPAARDALRAILDMRERWAEGPMIVRVLVAGSQTETKTWLERARQTLDQRGLPDSTVRRAGPPSEAIFSEVKEKDIDLIAMGATSRNPLIEYFVGSATARVLNKTRLPLLISRVRNA